MRWAGHSGKKEWKVVDWMEKFSDQQYQGLSCVERAPSPAAFYGGCKRKPEAQDFF
jgi:hypothetical protein